MAEDRRPVPSLIACVLPPDGSSGSWFGEIGDPMLDEKERDSRH